MFTTTTIVKLKIKRLEGGIARDYASESHFYLKVSFYFKFYLLDPKLISIKQEWFSDRNHWLTYFSRALNNISQLCKVIVKLAQNYLKAELDKTTKLIKAKEQMSRILNMFRYICPH
jgi:hypothetical protein